MFESVRQTDRETDASWTSPRPREVVAGMASEPGTQSIVKFQTKEEEPAQRKLGKLTVKYNRKDLQRRLDIEEWIDGQLHLLFDCEVRQIQRDALQHLPCHQTEVNNAPI